ncbi:hypothetical protein [Algoriphagus sp. AK58]|nr:hypothetical protein [Algoriphagus sp. AK58]
MARFGLENAVGMADNKGWTMPTGQANLKRQSRLALRFRED